ncbi:TonB family protein [Lysobacter sp. K5869]|uniref:energy transducer TonB n=1 Tax=Lysobacter sp. K5869 TaxID=2820808 RepID=UPI001C05FE03|nr:TonB family protein [Lysobacter sp. K5869]QWP77553.1 TonB family protein [Lysobacter sp. K5869]
MQGIRTPDPHPNYLIAGALGLALSVHAALLLALTLPVRAPADADASFVPYVGVDPQGCALWDCIPRPNFLHYAPERTRIGEVRPAALADDAAPPSPSLIPAKALRLPAPSQALSLSFSARPRTLELWVRVSANGAVREIKVLRSSGYYELDDLAVANALKRWRFTPAFEDRRAVESAVLVSVEFGIFDVLRPPVY